MAYPVIGIIVGSVRAGRIGVQITQWVRGVASEQTDLGFRVIDLADWPLPMDDEPDLPASGEYRQPHTRRWSEAVAELEGFVFVTPQYNWGYPAALKNALDHLSGEWAGKPALIVSYANRGGQRAADQLREVLQCLKMDVIPDAVGLPLIDVELTPDGALADPARDLDRCKNALRAGLRAMAGLLPEATLACPAPNLAT